MAQTNPACPGPPTRGKQILTPYPSQNLGLGQAIVGAPHISNAGCCQTRLHQRKAGGLVAQVAMPIALGAFVIDTESGSF